jgi:hypothetical protein
MGGSDTPGQRKPRRRVGETGASWTDLNRVLHIAHVALVQNLRYEVREPGGGEPAIDFYDGENVVNGRPAEDTEQLAREVAEPIAFAVEPDRRSNGGSYAAEDLSEDRRLDENGTGGKHTRCRSRLNVECHGPSL